MLDTGRPYPVGISSSEFRGWRARVRLGEVDDGNAYHAFGGVAGHAGLFGRARDLLVFGRRVLSALHGEGPWRGATVRRFLDVGPDTGQALGFRAWPVGGCATPAYGHTGFPGVAFAVLPSHGAVVALLTNRLHTPTPPPPAPFEPHWLRILDAVHREGGVGECASSE
ncbi:MAG: serine hydrolase, partial [Actinoallomurus sp.]